MSSTREAEPLVEGVRRILDSIRTQLQHHKPRNSRNSLTIDVDNLIERFKAWSRRGVATHQNAVRKADRLEKYVSGLLKRLQGEVRDGKTSQCLKYTILINSKHLVESEVRKLRDLTEHVPPEIQGPLLRAEHLVTELNKASGTIGEAASFSSRSGTAASPIPVELWGHANVVYGLLCAAFVCRCRDEHCMDLLLPLTKPSTAALSVVFRFSASPKPAFEPLWAQRSVAIVERSDSLLNRPLTLSPVKEDAPFDAFQATAKSPG